MPMSASATPKNQRLARCERGLKPLYLSLDNSKITSLLNENMQPQEILDAAREVLHIEATALIDQSAHLDENFIKAIDMILTCKGRVVVSHWHGSAQLKGVFSFQREYPLWNPKRNARGVPLDPRHCGIAA